METETCFGWAMNSIGWGSQFRWLIKQHQARSVWVQFSAHKVFALPWFGSQYAWEDWSRERIIESCPAQSTPLRLTGMASNWARRTLVSLFCIEFSSSFKHMRWGTRGESSSRLSGLVTSPKPRKAYISLKALHWTTTPRVFSAQDVRNLITKGNNMGIIKVARHQPYCEVRVTGGVVSGNIVLEYTTIVGDQYCGSRPGIFLQKPQCVNRFIQQ